MGCFSSKIATKTRSFKKELSLSLQRRTTGFPAFEELLLVGSKNGGNRSKKSTTSSDASMVTGDQSDDHSKTTHEDPETINTWELMSGLDDEEEEAEQEGREPESGSEAIPPVDAQVGSSGDIGDTIHRTSFHEAGGHEGKEDLPEESRKSIELWLEGSRDGAEDPISVSSAQQQPGGIRSIGCVAETTRRDAAEADSIEEKHHRRRASGARSFEFLSVGSLKEWLTGGEQLRYASSRLGRSARNGGQEGDDHGVFDAELVADLEEAMQQLTAEEEEILKQILEGLEGN